MMSVIRSTIQNLRDWISDILEARKELLAEKNLETACEYFHLLQKWEQQYAPQTPEDDLHPLFVEALHRKTYTEYLLGSFLDGSPEERRELVAQQGKEVMKLEQRIAEWTAAGTLHRGTGQKQPGTDRER